jgi:hypothetical protein
LLILIENRIFLASNNSKQSFGEISNNTLALFLFVLSFFFNVIVNFFDDSQAFELVGMFGDVMTGEFNGLAFGVLLRRFFFHDSL